jgi:hypothetical protein
VVAGESPLRGMAQGLSDQGVMCSGCHVAAASLSVIPRAAALGTNTMSTNQMIQWEALACLLACVRACIIGLV